MLEMGTHFVVQDYTETLHQLSESGVFDLFQPEYTRSLIVSLSLFILHRLIFSRLQIM